MFSSFNPFQYLGGHTHHILIFEYEFIMEMRISTVLTIQPIVISKDEFIMEMKIITVPGDKLTLAVKQGILEMKIIEKEIIQVHQKIELKMIINPVQFFEFGFDYCYDWDKIMS